MKNIIGKTVLSIRGFSPNGNKVKYVEPRFILLDDKETYIELEEQDYYSYHDCSSSARHIIIRKDSEGWNRINNDKKIYPVGNIDI